jgi:nitroreductase
LADWAPTHGRTEPWRFFAFAGEGKDKFCKDHAQLYWDHTDEDKRQQATYDKLATNGDLASHIVVAVMKRGANDKIPMHEELEATAAAIQNVLLGATAAGIASFWSTGGMTHKAPMKEYLGLAHEDHVLGLIYLGYSDEPVKDGVRNTPWTDKVQWM